MAACSSEHTCTKVDGMRGGLQTWRDRDADVNQSEVIAYAAGLLDGRGVIVIGASKYGRGHVNHWLQVSIRASEKEPLEMLKGRFDGEISGAARAPKSGWLWRAMGHDALQFLRRVRPHLLMKARHADIAIAFQAEKKDLDGLSVVDRHTELARRAAQKVMLQQLTRRRRIANAGEPMRSVQRRFPGQKF